MTDKAYPELPKAHLPRGGFPDLFTAEQLAAAVAAEREKCAGIVNELRMECARRNTPESTTMLWHAEDAIRAGAPPDTPREAGAVAGGAA